MDEPSSMDLFLRGETDVRTFGHADHVRVAFALLKAYDFSTASATFSKALKQIAARAGIPGAYHETMTVAFLALIAEQSGTGCFDSADAFVRGHPDVMDKTILERWYSPERLNSDIARRTFILPEATR